MSDDATDLAFLDATAQAELVRSGQASPTELVEAAITRIEKLDPQLNAVIHPLFDRARAEAAGTLPDGPFRGVPFLLKDFGAELAGTPFNEGTDFTPRDIRYTSRGDTVYAITLGEPTGQVSLATLGGGGGHHAVRSVHLLGVAQPPRFRQSGAALVVDLPATLPTRHASALKIQLRS